MRWRNSHFSKSAPVLARDERCEIPGDTFTIDTRRPPQEVPPESRVASVFSSDIAQHSGGHCAAGVMGRAFVSRPPYWFAFCASEDALDFPSARDTCVRTLRSFRPGPSSSKTIVTPHKNGFTLAIRF